MSWIALMKLQYFKCSFLLFSSYILIFNLSRRLPLLHTEMSMEFIDNLEASNVCNEFKWFLLVAHIFQHWVSFLLFLCSSSYLFQVQLKVFCHLLCSWLNEINGIVGGLITPTPTPPSLFFIGLYSACLCKVLNKYYKFQIICCAMFLLLQRWEREFLRFQNVILEQCKLCFKIWS